MVILGIIIISAVFSFLATKTSYYILKFLAGGSWLAAGLYWQIYPPYTIAEGSAIHVIIYILFYVWSLAFMFYPFWRGNGDNNGGKIVPFWRSEEDEEESTRKLPTRRERNNAYSQRVSRALRNNR